MVEAFRKWADQRATSPAVTVEATTISYGDLERLSNRVARTFQELGVEEGDFVTIALPNSVDWMVVALATLKAGAIIQPISHRLPLAERQAIVNLAKPALIVGANPADHPGVRCITGLDQVAISADDSAPPLKLSPAWKAPTSGGSTGRPKLIVSGTPAVLDDEAPPDWLLPRLGTVLVPGPLYHSSPLNMSVTSMWHGNHVVLETRFDAATTVRLINSYKPAFILLVPTMMHRILALPPSQRQVDWTPVKTIFHMGSKCSSSLKREWLDWAGPDRVFELYGASDGPAHTIISGREWLDHEGSVGRAVVGEIRIGDEEGSALPHGEVGEIWMRGSPGAPPKFRYIGSETRDRNGWLTIGDMGWMDRDGYLYISDRRTDMIVSGGANVYPAEVEAALESYPGVTTAVVVGLPDADLGQRVHAIVEAAEGVSEDELREHMSRQLVRYKAPRTYEFVANPLRDDSGKVRRSELLAARVAPGPVPVGDLRTV